MWISWGVQWKREKLTFAAGKFASTSACSFSGNVAIEEGKITGNRISGDDDESSILVLGLLLWENTSDGLKLSCLMAFCAYCFPFF